MVRYEIVMTFWDPWTGTKNDPRHGLHGCHVQILNKKSGLKIFKKTFESHNLGSELG